LSGQKKKSKIDGIIIFSGFNERSVIALCRTLEACKVEFHIIAHSPNDVILDTIYASYVSSIRTKPMLDIDDLYNCIEVTRAGTNRKFAIAPTSEALNLFLLDHRHRIEQSGDILPLVSKELYRMLSDKISFIDVCRQYSIPVPRELSSLDVHDLPIVAKPHRENTSDGRRCYPLLLYTEQDLEKFAGNIDNNLYFLQTYIRGPSYYLQYYFHSSGQVDRFSMRNLVQQPEGKSIIAAEPACLHLDKTYRIFEMLLQDLGFTGLVMIEIMFENDCFYMIEANPRMWGPAQLMIDAGSNLYVSLINDLFGFELPLDICEKSVNPLYFWWAGFWEPQLKGKSMKWYCPPSFFWEKYPEFFRSEIYNREDTRNIFLKEAKELPIPVRNI